jgi:hypothetical protein
MDILKGYKGKEIITEKTSATKAKTSNWTG